MATDFRDGTTFPRRGRQALGDALWLARVSDKARAAAAGTLHDYIYPCPMDQGVFERWGITPDDFNDAIARHTNDDALLEWLMQRSTAEKIAAANAWLTKEKKENLDRQDREETGAAA